MAVTTEPAWLNKSSGVAARNGTTSHTIPFGFTSTSGSFLVVVVFGAVTHAVTGWTERLQPVSSGELSVFTKTSAGDSSIVVTHNGSNYPVGWVAFEFPAGAAYTAGIGSTPSADTFPALTGLPGTAQVVIAARGRNSSDQSSTASSVWTAPWVEDFDQSDPRGGTPVTDGMYLTVGHQLNVTSTSITPVATPTYGGTQSVADREHVVFALNVPALAGGVTVSPSGIASAEAFGTTTSSTALAVSPSGVSSAQAFGTVQIQNVLTLSPVGIASAQAFGTPGATIPIQASPTGIASAQVFGTTVAAGSLTVSPTAIASAQAFGVLAVSVGLTSTASAISSAEAFGTPAVSGALAVSPAGIASQEAFGAAAISGALTVSPGGIVSAQSFGVPLVVAAGSVTPAGIASAEAFGAPTVSSALTAQPAGIASAQATGTPAVQNLLAVSPAGIPSAQAFGALSVSLTIQAAPAGIGSLEAFGVPVVSGALVVLLAGIASTEAFGVPVTTGGGVVIPFADVDLQVGVLVGSSFSPAGPSASNPFTVAAPTGHPLSVSEELHT